jgi:diguanylate cyclase (GGDEF)-like protein
MPAQGARVGLVDGGDDRAPARADDVLQAVAPEGGALTGRPNAAPTLDVMPRRAGHTTPNDGGHRASAAPADTSCMRLSWEDINGYMRRMPDALLFAIGLALIVALTVLKMTLGQRIPLVDFLLVPVVWVGWFAGSRSYGYALALIAALVSAVIAVFGITQASVGSACASALARFALYLVILGLLGMMRRERAGHQHAAATDPHTGLANARAFDALAAAEVVRSQRFAHPLSLAYLDLDDFKAVNDAFGHDCGDQALFDIGHVLRSTVRSVDLAARIGGDEFAVLMPETGAPEAHAVVERVRGELARLTVGDGRHLLFSIGVVTFDRPPGSLKKLTAAADELLYRAKDNGKDRVEQSERAGSFLAAERPAAGSPAAWGLAPRRDEGSPLGAVSRPNR